ncbi:MAG: hypothetical protein WC109_06140 [Syntrophomonadaceae bacterium]|jgi:uncharacterized membrane protein YhfC|nr:hypothetical protein [Syntrophomonadaceae bacterium]MDD3271622.1 hypothetical protein [Syntrophomonadaceae bacterium]
MKKFIEFMDRPDIRKKTRWILIAILIGLVLIDPFMEKHPVFAVEKLPAFYAIYGFLSCALIVAVSKIIGKLWLQKREDYYD